MGLLGLVPFSHGAGGTVRRPCRRVADFFKSEAFSFIILGRGCVLYVIVNAGH